MKHFIIYQLPLSNPCIFREELAKPEDYVAVWVEKLPDCLDCDIYDLLEHLFAKFNSEETPENFAGHSLSISDIVALVETDELTNVTSRTFWQCATVGWKHIEFPNDEEEAE